jgi:Fic family protein
MYTPIFTISNKILRNIGIIEAAREVIKNAPLLPYYEKQFRKDALVRQVHFGTHIEGNELNRDQAEKVIDGLNVVARDRDIQEVLNYRKVMEQIDKFSVQSGQFRINEEMILYMHQLTVAKLLEEEKTGKYRQTQVVVKNSRSGEVSFTPPPATEVRFAIQELEDFINSDTDIHAVLKSGIFHYEFVRIHPFIDGNGRVARALSTFILYKEGYDIRKFFSLEEYFDTQASRYYAALQSVGSNKGDLTVWLEYFTEGLAIELSKIKDKVEKISIDGKLRERLGGKPLLLTERQLKIIEFIQQVGFLQNQAFSQLFPMISEDTILNELKGLLSTGIIKKQGKTKGAKYVMG